MLDGVPVDGEVELTSIHHVWRVHMKLDSVPAKLKPCLNSCTSYLGVLVT